MLSLRFLGLALVATPAAFATDLGVTVHSNGSSSVTVPPGAVVPFTVTLELTDGTTDGLAGFALDLEFDGGALTVPTAPATGPTLAFRSPTGFSNPAGFAGTLIDGALRQIGGAQNTIQNSFAPEPQGAVILDVAQPGSGVVVVTGNVQAPTEGGTFTLSAKNVVANAIAAGSGPFPFYAVEALEAQVTDLVITVPTTLSRDIAQLSLATGGTQNLVLDAGLDHAGEIFWMLGSLSGTLPGFRVNGFVVPLNHDSYTTYTLVHLNAGPLLPSVGILDGQGQAGAALTIPAGTGPGLAGVTVNHAYVLLTPNLEFASNSASLTLIP